MNDGKTEENKRKPAKRRPLWLMTPAGRREIESADGTMTSEPLYTMEKFMSQTDLVKEMARREIDATNAAGILLFRSADPIGVETKITTQVVFKFGRKAEAEGGDEGGGDEGEEGTEV